MTDVNASVYGAGHLGMVGSAIVRMLKKRGYRNIITRAHKELDLTEQQAVRSFFAAERPQQVYLAAAKVGGIHANNSYPVEFIYRNLMIESKVIHEAWKVGVQKLLFLGSSCIYPKLATQPMSEDALLTGPLEPTNEPYAIAKIAGVKLCESYNRQYGTDYRTVMPTNLYGPGDNYHPEYSHVIPALIRRSHEAKRDGMEQVDIWGTASPKREFLYVDDLAEAIIFVQDLEDDAYIACTQPMQNHINVGTGKDISIRELAETIGEVVGYTGKIEFDPAKPDGSPRKLLNISCLNSLGWQPRTSLLEGLRQSYSSYLVESSA